MATKESRVERLKVRGERLEAGIAAELQSNPISNSNCQKTAYLLGGEIKCRKSDRSDL